MMCVLRFGSARVCGGGVMGDTEIAQVDNGSVSSGDAPTAAILHSDCGSVRDDDQERDG